MTGHKVSAEYDFYGRFAVAGAAGNLDLLADFFRFLWHFDPPGD